MRPTILTLESCLALLSALGVVQRRWKALRLAIVLGWFGAFPGFCFEFLSVGTGLRFPEHMGVIAISWEIVRGIGGLFLTYLVFVLPMFGSYCLVVGLAGGAFINRYTQPPAPRWAQTAAIIAASAGAAVPVVLLFPEFIGAAAVSSVFWATALLPLRRKLFV